MPRWSLLIQPTSSGNLLTPWRRGAVDRELGEMKTFFKCFCVAFAVGCVVGLIYGRMQHNRTSGETQLQQTVIHHLHYKTEVDVYGAKQLRLSYLCKGVEYYVHSPSPEDDHGEYTQSAFPVVVEDAASSLGEELELIFASATGMHVNEIIVFFSRGLLEEKAVEWNKQKLFAVLLGTATGFYAGRWITARGEPACDSPKVLAGLQNNTLWLSSIRILMKDLLARTVVLQWKEKPVSVTERLPQFAIFFNMSRHPKSSSENEEHCYLSLYSVRLLQVKVNDVNYRISNPAEFYVALHNPVRVMGCLSNDDLIQLFPHYVGWTQTFSLLDEIPESSKKGVEATVRSAESFVHIFVILMMVIPAIVLFAGTGYLLVRIFG
jgi:hypothetical protein